MGSGVVIYIFIISIFRKVDLAVDVNILFITNTSTSAILPSFVHEGNKRGDKQRHAGFVQNHRPRHRAATVVGQCRSTNTVLWSWQQQRAPTNILSDLGGR